MSDKQGTSTIRHVETPSGRMSYVEAGSGPVAGLREASRALRIVEAAYLSASRGGMPVQLSTLP